MADMDRYRTDPEFRARVLAANAAWRRAHRDQIKLKRKRDAAKYKAWKKAWYLKNKYGMTHAEFDAMVRRQGGHCAICRQPPKRKYLCVDHDHTTQKVRALLCDRCNTLVGQLEVNAHLIESAKAYLRAHS